MSEKIFWTAGYITASYAVALSSGGMAPIVLISSFSKLRTNYNNFASK